MSATAENWEELSQGLWFLEDEVQASALALRLGVLGMFDSRPDRTLQGIPMMHAPEHFYMVFKFSGNEKASENGHTVLRASKHEFDVLSFMLISLKFLQAMTEKNTKLELRMATGPGTN